jgi:hypothetical protein
MSNFVLEDLDQVFSAIRQQLDRKDPSKSQKDDAAISSKIKATLKSYPTWAKQTRELAGYQPPTDAAQPTQPNSYQMGVGPRITQQTTAQQRQVKQKTRQDMLPTPDLRAAPTSIAGYDAKRAAAANRAQADMRRGKPPDYTTPMPTLVRQRQARGMTEGKFSDLYALLESAILEQQVDPGSFTNYLKTIVKFDPSKSDPVYMQQIDIIEKLYNDNKISEAEREAAQLLELIYKQQLLKSRNSSSTASSSFNDYDKTNVNKFLNGVQSNMYNEDELTNIVLYSLLKLKSRYPRQFTQITADIDSTLANYQKQIT